MTFSATLPNFSSDYQEGAHARVLDALVATNMEQSSGYGTDEHCERARNLIREACQAPDADVYFLVGGTQTNATVIDAILLPGRESSPPTPATSTCMRPALSSAVVTRSSTHRLWTARSTPPTSNASVQRGRGDGARDHMIAPALVYISQPTEYGTLYSLQEIEDLSRVCRERA